MAELEEEVTLDVPTAHVDFLTRTNGDKSIFSRLHVTAEQAATIAWLINTNEALTLELKHKE
jgi:hypothetical protein